MPPRQERDPGRAPRRPRTLHLVLRTSAVSLSFIAAASVLLGACTTSPSGRCYSEAAPPGPVVAPVATPAVANGVVYVDYATINPIAVSLGRTGVAAFRANDGTLLWQRTDPLSPCCVSNRLVASGSFLLLSNHLAHMLAALRSSDGTLLWRLPREVNPQDTPVVAGGILYAGDDQGVYAVRLADGMLLWQVPPPADQSGSSSTAIPNTTPAPQVSSDPGALVLAGDVLYVGWGNGVLTALRARDGAQLWQVVALSPVTAQGLPTQLDPVAVVGGDMLYVRVGATGGGFAYAVLLVRTRDGHVVGHLPAPAGPGTAGSSSNGLFTGYAFDPVVIGGTLYIGLTWGYTYVLETVAGQHLWQISLRTVRAQVIAQDDGIIFLGSSGEVIAVHMAGATGAGGALPVQSQQGQPPDGVVLWRLPLSDIAVGGGRLYVGDVGHAMSCPTTEIGAADLRALNETDGHVVWVRNLTLAD